MIYPNEEKPMTNNAISMIVVLIIFLTFGTACRLLKTKEINQGKPAGNSSSDNSEITKNIVEKTQNGQPRGIISIDDKPDFNLQAEELVKAKKEAPNPIKPPDKYKGKIIQVTGRVSYLYPESEKSLSPRVQLKGGESIIDDFACEFDEENKAEIRNLKKDQLVTLKGLVPDMWLLHPSLQHCIIVEPKL
jgi:tRNA_anti-like